MFDKHLFTVACAGPATLVTAGQAGEILSTTDSGAQWTPAPAPRNRDIYDVVPMANGALVALGDLGTVLVSSADGRPGSWQLLSESADGTGFLYLIMPIRLNV